MPFACEDDTHALLATGAMASIAFVGFSFTQNVGHVSLNCTGMTQAEKHDNLSYTPQVLLAWPALQRMRTRRWPWRTGLTACTTTSPRTAAICFPEHVGGREGWDGEHVSEPRYARLV